jgi:uncharacterized repeat protein (TIGR01451 family)
MGAICALVLAAGPASAADTPPPPCSANPGIASSSWGFAKDTGTWTFTVTLRAAGCADVTYPVDVYRVPTTWDGKGFNISATPQDYVPSGRSELTIKAGQATATVTVGLTSCASPLQGDVYGRDGSLASWNEKDPTGFPRDADGVIHQNRVLSADPSGSVGYITGNIVRANCAPLQVTYTPTCDRSVSTWTVTNPNDAAVTLSWSLPVSGEQATKGSVTVPANGTRSFTTAAGVTLIGVSDDKGHSYGTEGSLAPGEPRTDCTVPTPVTPIAASTLSLGKTINGGTATVETAAYGDTLHYALTATVVGSAGAQAQTDVVVTDTVPAGTTLVPGSVACRVTPAGSGDATPCSATVDGTSLRATDPGDLTPGQSLTLAFDVTIDRASGPVTIDNVGCATSASIEQCVSSNQVEAKVTTAVEGVIVEKPTTPPTLAVPAPAAVRPEPVVVAGSTLPHTGAGAAGQVGLAGALLALGGLGLLILGRRERPQGD